MSWLFLVLACTDPKPEETGGGGDDGDDSSADSADDTTSEMEELPPTPYAIYTDTEGNQADEVEEPSILCGEATYLGYVGGAWCQDDGVHGFFQIMTDTLGRTEDDVEDRGELCPAGSTWVGANGVLTSCVTTKSVQELSLTVTAEGLTLEDADDPADLCPEDTTWVGLRQGDAPVCLVSGWADIHYLDTSAYGQTYDGSNGPEICGEGWTFMGEFWDYAQCLRDEGTTVALSENLDGETYDGTNGPEVCPDGWAFVGSTSDSPMCWTSEAHSVVFLEEGADGTRFRGLDSGSEVCPEGWTFLGAIGRLALCLL